MVIFLQQIWLWRGGGIGRAHRMNWQGGLGMVRLSRESPFKYQERGFLSLLVYLLAKRPLWILTQLNVKENREDRKGNTKWEIN